MNVDRRQTDRTQTDWWRCRQTDNGAEGGGQNLVRYRAL